MVPAARQDEHLISEKWCAQTSQWWPLSFGGHEQNKTVSRNLLDLCSTNYKLHVYLKAYRYSRENVVDADDAVRSGWSAVVYNGCITLNPNPATVLGQETVVLRCDLAFHQHCSTKRRERNHSKQLLRREKFKQIAANPNLENVTEI